VTTKAENLSKKFQIGYLQTKNFVVS